jgi:hypothetical protein
MSGSLTTGLVEAGKVIIDGGEYDNDGDLGAVQAGPLMARRQCSQGRQGPCVRAGGVRCENQDQGLSLGWKIRARLGCFQWRQLLVCLAIKKAKEGAAVLLY